MSAQPAQFLKNPLEQSTATLPTPRANTTTLPALLTRPLQGKVAAAIADKDVGVLVNNVGVSYPFPKYFDELTDDEVRRHCRGVADG